MINRTTRDVLFVAFLYTYVSHYSDAVGEVTYYQHDTYGTILNNYYNYRRAWCSDWLPNASLKECVRECFLRSDSCGYIGYDRHLHICYICANLDIYNRRKWQRHLWTWRMLTSSISTWEQDKAVMLDTGSSCSNPAGSSLHGDGKDDSSASNVGMTDVECNQPPYVFGAVASRPLRWKVETRVRFTCIPNYVPQRNLSPYVTCQPNGTWTETDFRCLQLTTDPAR